ncbi:hypothetical protein [Mangrovibacter sp. MFB070]|uniref:gp53-like domain-containing protein n=1 Tax=Mangrovibacter sp. MFB070 TaxID=1224318 RepID=UPI001268A56C|nr:hypothetical protein [Mangrovibacter sp. MFB070]
MPNSGRTVILLNLGLGNIALAGVCTGSQAFAGYITIPMIISGAKKNLIIQWGLTTTNTAGSGSAYTTTLPVAFPNYFAQVVLSHDDTTSTAVGFGSGTPATLSTFTTRANKITQSGTTITGSSANVSFRYIAIGY